mgnify:CR=1 FL=1
MEDAVAIVAIITLVLNAISTIVQTLEHYRERKAQEILILQNFENRFDHIHQEGKEFQDILIDPNFDLLELQEKDEKRYYRLLHWCKQLFWLDFDEWYAGHIAKCVSKEQKLEWDAILREKMQEPVFRQVWEKVLRKDNFRGKRKFNKFMDRHWLEGKLKE